MLAHDLSLDQQKGQAFIEALFVHFWAAKNEPKSCPL